MLGKAIRKFQNPKHFDPKQQKRLQYWGVFSILLISGTFFTAVGIAFLILFSVSQAETKGFRAEQITLYNAVIVQWNNSFSSIFSNESFELNGQQMSLQSPPYTFNDMAYRYETIYTYTPEAFQVFSITYPEDTLGTVIQLNLSSSSSSSFQYLTFQCPLYYQSIVSMDPVKCVNMNGTVVGGGGGGSSGGNQNNCQFLFQLTGFCGYLKNSTDLTSGISGCYDTLTFESDFTTPAMNNFTIGIYENIGSNFIPSTPQNLTFTLKDRHDPDLFLYNLTEGSYTFGYPWMTTIQGIYWGVCMLSIYLAVVIFGFLVCGYYRYKSKHLSKKSH